MIFANEKYLKTAREIYLYPLTVNPLFEILKASFNHGYKIEGIETS